MTLKTIIIEDDVACYTLLKKYCETTKLLELLGHFSTATAALNSPTLLEAELIFLDIEMPEMTGLQFLEKLKHQPQIVFTTTKKEYAVEAYNYRATDFLEKPISFYRFQQTLAIAVETKINRQKNTVALPEGQSSKNIFIKEGGRWVRIELDDILYFENDGDYVKVITKTKKHLIYRTMKSIAETVKDGHFLRIHRSYIINLNKIIDIEDNTLLINKKVIPIGKAHKSKLMRVLNTL